MVKSEKLIALWKLSIFFSTIILLIPTVSAETITTFSDMGIAKEFTSDNEGTTPVGTFNISSNEQPLEIVVYANRNYGYKLTIYLNDAPIKSQDFNGDGTFLVIVPPENLKKGLNKIYVKATSSNRYWHFAGSYKLIIYGTSKIGYALTSTPTPTSTSISGQPSKPSVSLHGDKTDVVLGEDIILKLSALNLITKPKMHVQVIIIPPSGMSVTSSEFSKVMSGQFAANYELEPGDGKDIEVRIKSNQAGQFNVDGRVVYYFGDDKDTGGDSTLSLPIKVREVASQTPVATPTQKSIPGFRSLLAVVAILIGFSIKRGLKHNK
ncbi:MAG: hypothetical protein PHU34_02085 [Candidatus Methanoperedens sp.]|nr:hypothetical protein [Candidatus Methanoperedens sp.]